LPNPRNARTHSAQQIQQIARSIERFGFNNPVLVDQNNRVIAGHGRVAAAKSLGHDVVPTLRIEHLSDEEKRAYIIADNKLAEKAGWDTEILAIEFQRLGELGFELELTGFELPEIFQRPHDQAHHRFPGGCELAVVPASLSQNQN
jgi:ParB-like chromosome segregation protein Spo0J